jgi:hypothetical protein
VVAEAPRDELRIPKPIVEAGQDEFRLDGLQIDAEAVDLVERLGKPPRPAVIVGEPLDHRLEGDDAGVSAFLGSSRLPRPPIIPKKPAVSKVYQLFWSWIS